METKETNLEKDTNKEHNHEHVGCGNPNCGCASKDRSKVKEHKCAHC